MKTLIYALMPLAAYIVLIFAPATAFYFVVFARKNGVLPGKAKKTRYYYAGYLDRMLAGIKYLESQKTESVSITARDGAVLKGDYIPSGSGRLVIFAHGYRTTPIEGFCIVGELLNKQGYDLLFISQRAHGKSGGKHSTLGILEQYDLLEWVKWAEYKGASDILLYGISMGCATIAYASDKLAGSRVRAMVLDCGFISPYEQLKSDCMKLHMPWQLLLPVVSMWAKLFLRIDIAQPVGDSLARTNIPAFFLHGTADRTVPIWQGRHNFELCASAKECAFIEGADHTVSFPEGGPELEAMLFGFINKYMNHRNGG